MKLLIAEVYSITSFADVGYMFNDNMANRENIGMSRDEMYLKWNQDHPDNQYLAVAIN